MRFAVSHIDFFEHDLTTVIVSASNWYEALIQHPKIKPEFGYPDDSIESAKIHAFDMDSMIHVEEIPGS